MRKTALDALCQGNNWLHPYYADHTFEVDFIKSGNQEILKSVVENVYTAPATVVTSNAELSSTYIAVSGQRALAMANYKKKGWFALTLAEKIKFNVSIPKYIIDAVIFSHGEINPNTLEKIIAYRFNAIIEYAHERREYVASLNAVSQAQFINQWIAHLNCIDTNIAIFRPKWENYLSRKSDIQGIKTMFINDIPGMGSQILEGL